MVWDCEVDQSEKKRSVHPTMLDTAKTRSWDSSPPPWSNFKKKLSGNIQTLTGHQKNSPGVFMPTNLEADLCTVVVYMVTFPWQNTDLGKFRQIALTTLKCFKFSIAFQCNVEKSGSKDLNLISREENRFLLSNLFYIHVTKCVSHQTVFTFKVRMLHLKILVW